MNPWDIACRHYLEQAGVNMSDHHAVDEGQREAFEFYQRGYSLHEWAEMRKLTADAVAHHLARPVTFGMAARRTLERRLPR